VLCSVTEDFLMALLMSNLKCGIKSWTIRDGQDLILLRNATMQLSTWWLLLKVPKNSTTFQMKPDMNQLKRHE
jgi:hypothetical protein